MIIDENYNNEIKDIRLSNWQINCIIEELNRTEHNLYEFLDYAKIIDKLKIALKENSQQPEREQGMEGVDSQRLLSAGTLFQKYWAKKDAIKEAMNSFDWDFVDNYAYKKDVYDIVSRAIKIYQRKLDGQSGSFVVSDKHKVTSPIELSSGAINKIDKEKLMNYFDTKMTEKADEKRIKNRRNL